MPIFEEDGERWELLDFWGDFGRATHSCRACGWSGLGSGMPSGESFRDGADKHCPACDERYGFVQYPLTVPEPGRTPTPIFDQIGSPIHPEGECVLLDGDPCILFANWDYAEDWSGDYVRELHPFALVSAPAISPDEFWTLVRRGHTTRPEPPSPPASRERLQALVEKWQG